MALSVTELLRLLAPSPTRWEFALRQAVICALVALVAEIYQTPDAALTIYIVFFLNKPDRVTSLIMNIAFVVLISIVIGLVIITAILVVDRPALRVASIALLSFGMLFLASASKLRPVGTTVALIVGYALDLLGTTPGGEVATRALLYAWLFVGMPAGVSMVVNLLIAPSPRRLLERALAERLRLAAAILRDPDAPTAEAFSECLREGPGEIPEWLKLCGVEKTSPPADIVALRQAAQSTTAILLLVDLATRDPDRMLPLASREPAANVLDDMASILRAGGYPVEVAFDVDASEAELSPLSRAVLGDLHSAIVSFAEPPPSVAAPRAEAKPSGGFFLPDAFTNREHVQYALKTTAAAMFCYGLYSLLDWPGIHTCFITCYIVALTTTAEAVEKLTLRIVGCLIGAAAGIAAIVFLLPSLTSIGTLMAVVLAAAFGSAWIAAGSPRIAYAGFQIAFAFFLCSVQGPAPAFDMTVARDRVIGILLGDVVSYLVFTMIWPVSVAQRIDPALSALLRRLSAIVAATDLAVRRVTAGEVLASYGAVERDLGLVPYEPRWTRPDESWLRQRVRTAREIMALAGPLLLSADRAPENSAAVRQRLNALTTPADEAPMPVAPANDSTATAEGAAVQELVDAHLQQLKQAIDREEAQVHALC